MTHDLEQGLWILFVSTGWATGGIGQHETHRGMQKTDFFRGKIALAPDVAPGFSPQALDFLFYPPGINVRGRGFRGSAQTLFLALPLAIGIEILQRLQIERVIADIGIGDDFDAILVHGFGEHQAGFIDALKNSLLSDICG